MGAFAKIPLLRMKGSLICSSPQTAGIPEKDEALSKYRCYKGKTLVIRVGGSTETEYVNWQEYQMHDGYFK